jgi:hypothetical protein
MYQKDFEDILNLKPIIAVVCKTYFKIVTKICNGLIFRGFKPNFWFVELGRILLICRMGLYFIFHIHNFNYYDTGAYQKFNWYFTMD